MPVTVADAIKRQLTPAAAKVFQFLDAASPNDLYLTSEITEACDISETTLRRIGRECDLEAYRVLYDGNTYYWGHPEAIKAYVKGRE